MSNAARRSRLDDFHPDEAGSYSPQNYASSAEPMPRPDHKAKRRGRPTGERHVKVRWNKRSAA